jgi:hypothetical protein
VRIDGSNARARVRRCGGATVLCLLLSLTSTAGPAFAQSAPAGSWQATGAMLDGVENPTATVLRSGQVLVAGGSLSGGSSDAETHTTTTRAELFDPATGEWSLTGSLLTPRVLAAAALLPSGAVLVVGGETGPGQSTTSAELYDPASGTWAATAPMEAPRAAPTVTVLASGRVLVVGGNFGRGPAAEIYDPASATWTPTGPMPLDPSVSPATAIPVDPAFALATLLPGSGDVLVAGGLGLTSRTDGNYHSTSTAERYDAASNSWRITGSMVTGSYLRGSTLLPSGDVLAVGGESAGGVTLSAAEVYDPATGTWTAIAPMETPRSEPSAVTLRSGDVLVAGGSLIRARSAEVYDPASGSWTATGPMVVPRFEQLAALLPTGQVLVAGGDLANPENCLSSAELYTPAGVAVGPNGIARKPGSGGGTSGNGGPTSGGTGPHSTAPRRPVTRVALTRCGWQTRLRGGRRVRTRRCTVRRFTRPGHLAIRGDARASLTRGRVVYATGTATSTRLSLRAARPIRPGRYELTLRYRRARRTLVRRQTLTVP